MPTKCPLRAVPFCNWTKISLNLFSNTKDWYEDSVDISAGRSSEGRSSEIPAKKTVLDDRHKSVQSLTRVLN
jgi:hypothetical protein